MSQPAELWRRTALAAVAAMAALLLVVASGGTAAAHEGEAVITVESAAAGDTAGDTSVAFTVRVTWANDGHAALDSTVTATPVASDGTTRTPVLLAAADEDGRYRGIVDLPDPGPWAVRFTSITPPGVLEVAAAEGSPSTTATGPTTSVPAPAPTEPAAPTTEPASSVTSTTSADEGPSEVTTTGESAAADGNADGGATWWPFAVVAGLALAGGAVVVARRRTTHQP